MSTKTARISAKRQAATAALLIAANLGAAAVHAQSASSSEIEDMKRTIQQLQRKIETIESKQAQASEPAAAPSPAPSDKYDGFKAGPLNIKLGGFFELAGIYRNKNETADIASNWNAVPYANSSNSDLSEFRESPRQSRISALISGPSDGHQRAEGYTEIDFLAAAQTANSKESNSYNPRIRHIYAAYYNLDSGFYLLAGQNWSLVTQEKKGMKPRDELTPAVIDAQYVPGFNWTRNPQIRLVEQFNDAFSAGLSIESPQGLFSGSAPKGIVSSSTAGSGFNSANSYSLDPLPDLVLKAALDPGWGHYELFGLARWFRDRQPATATVGGQNNTTSGVSIGGSVYLPLVPKVLDFQASALSGKGAGRYGSVQLPDATFDASGNVQAIKQTSILTGLVAHATPDLDLYAYAGREKVDANYSAIVSSTGGITGYTGYGIPTNNLSGCFTEGGTCAPNTKQVSQATLGGWWKFYRGSIGVMQLGAQVSFTKQEALPGLNAVAPAANLTVGMVSIRYYPYQQ